LELMPILKDSISAVKPIAKKRGTKIVITPPAQPCIILGDVSALQQVFINLLSNAVKFSPDASEVEVRVSRMEDETHVEVVDHGVGIPPDAMPYLFERFYRARNVNASEIPGSGIGLFIVKSILQELDGTISVSSKLNVGTIFTASLRNG
jgi:signal transduction histidine kinase